MLISRAEINAYAAELDKYSAAAQRQILKAWGIAQDLPIAEARELLITEMIKAEAKYGAAAAIRSAELTSGATLGTLAEMPVEHMLGAGVPAEQIEQAVRAAMRFAVKGEPDKTRDELLRSTDRYIKASAHEVPMIAAGFDGKIMYARVPRGKTTCSFCVMLASRGFVYHSAKGAGEFSQFHNSCDCMVVAGNGSTEVEGYDPDALYDEWTKACKEAGAPLSGVLTSAQHEAISEALQVMSESD